MGSKQDMPVQQPSIWSEVCALNKTFSIYHHHFCHCILSIYEYNINDVYIQKVQLYIVIVIIKLRRKSKSCETNHNLHFCSSEEESLLSKVIIIMINAEKNGRNDVVCFC